MCTLNTIDAHKVYIGPKGFLGRNVSTVWCKWVCMVNNRNMLLKYILVFLSLTKSSSSARLAIPEVVDRPCWNRVESAYWSGDFQKIFFLFDPSLTSGISVVLMWGHCLRHRPYIKQHMSAGRVAHRKRLRHRPPHLTATCMRVELMVSQRRRQRAYIKKTFFEKLMNIQYLNLPPYPNRWMVWLIQQGLAWRPRCVKTCCQEDGQNRTPT